MFTFQTIRLRFGSRALVVASFLVVITWGIVLTSVTAAAEPLVVDLWPGKPPQDAGLTAEESSRIYESPIVGPTKLISNVTKPTLTVYRPAKDNTKAAMIICPGGGYWNLFWEL